jgi:dynein heavy chain
MKVGAPKNERLYEEITDMNKIRNVLQDYQEDYNLTNNKNTRLVFFMDAIEHIARIARIIRQDRGNALLVGVGGTGKQSLTRLASHICGYKCFQIELSRGYNYDSFHEDLKKLYEQTGPNNENTVFLFTDNQIVVEEFLEDINNILNSGEVPNLFDKQDEYEKMIIGCRVSRTKLDIWKIFLTLISLVQEMPVSLKMIEMQFIHFLSIVFEIIYI